MTESACKRLCVPALLVVLAAAFLTFSPTVRAEEDNVVATEKLFREAIDLYEQGKYSESQSKLKAVQDKDPRNALIARLVDEAGVRVITKMMADVRMGVEPTRLWEQYRKYNLGKLADKDRMTKMAARLVDPNTSEDERALLYREFAQLGHYAVPFIAPHLKDATNVASRSIARLALAQMGQKATLPLIALLQHKDILMRENAALTIGDILPSDARTIPALKALIDDPKESEATKSYASRILTRITKLDAASWKSAAQYYYEAANRYYLDRPGVAEEAEEVSGMVWHLNDAGDLVSVQYPLWAWNEQMAESLTLRGLTLNAEMPEFFALWACVAASQWSEVKDLIDISTEQPPRHNFSAEEKTELAEWDKKLVDARRLIAAVGKEHCNAALNKAHADLKKFPGHIRIPGVAVVLAKELAMLDPKGDTLNEASGLIAGLSSPEFAVQYASAIALASVNKFPDAWAGSDKVGAILGRGISENKPFEILLVVENENLANELKQKINAVNYGVTVASSGRDAMTKARSFPPKDVVVIAENLKRDLNAYQLLEELRAEATTRYLPSGILHARADREIIQSRFGSDIGLIELESTGNDLKDPIEKIAAKRSETSANKRKAHEMSVLCASTLNTINPNATQIKLNDAVEHAVKAMIGRKDDVRNPCAVFLGRVEGGAMKDAAADVLKRVFEDGASPVELRRNVIRSLGRVKVDGLEDVYAKAQADADQEIKDLAAEAFGQKSRSGKAILDVISANRIDKDKKEK
ncbi:MAG: HEAT repeat domain-containing protein [Planctomycetota bacterium]